ncbi:MAG: hypothetical protein H6867_08935 [Rhodospirillales bacterium]|nr:hypothetical protein [Rhodospirillales bacterium]MCB9996070.1 hypothetical protein [Rhodospirillales bacterium]
MKKILMMTMALMLMMPVCAKAADTDTPADQATREQQYEAKQAAREAKRKEREAKREGFSKAREACMAKEEGQQECLDGVRAQRKAFRDQVRAEIDSKGKNKAN